MNNNLPTFVKWAGGKSQLIQQYKGLLPDKAERYFEPFLGSGAVFFYVKQHLKCKQFFLSDSNEELINTFLAVRDNVDVLIESLVKRKILHSKEYFLETRKEKPSELSRVERASRFIYLNKTCYNGLYRVNSKGEFNVPLGSYKRPTIVAEVSLRKASGLLKGADIKVRRFSETVSSATEGDFVYFDPPYLPISKTSSFTGYTRDSFLIDEQEELARLFERLDEKKCLLMLSNSDHPVTRQLYQKYNIHTVKARRAISSVGTDRKSTRLNSSHRL